MKKKKIPPVSMMNPRNPCLTSLRMESGAYVSDSGSTRCPRYIAHLKILSYTMGKGQEPSLARGTMRGDELIIEAVPPGSRGSQQ